MQFVDLTFRQGNDLKLSVSQTFKYGSNVFLIAADFDFEGAPYACPINTEKTEGNSKTSSISQVF